MLDPLLRSALFAVFLAVLPAAGLAQRGGDHWAFRAVERPELPVVRDGGQLREDTLLRSDVDRFVQARLEAAGLGLREPADDATLVRRLALDLTGLPATVDDLAFLQGQPAGVGYQKLVERLLESPAHAERMASIWLDLARYADSMGYGSDPLRTIWRYRDWVIEAYDRNLPFDQFTELQLAGDLLPGATWREQLPTALHRNTKNNTEGGTDDEEFRVEAVRDRVDTTLLVWMGLSAGCAKCHDHKYDPVSQREYYQLYDFFNHTADADRNDDRPTIETPTPEQELVLAALDARLAELESALAAPRADLETAATAWARQQVARQRALRSLRQIEVQSGPHSGQGAEVTRSSDGWIEIGGAAPATDVLVVEGVPREDQLGTLRLEVGLDSERVGAAAGRASIGRAPGNGNAVLSELRVGVVPAPAARVTGRYVRVELPAGEFLSLAEVRVVDAQGIERAQGKAARQSSTGFDGPAGLAVDGNPSGVYTDGSVTHTAAGDRAKWWEVDLGADFEIARIEVFNRTDGDLEQRLAGYRLAVLDAARQEVWATSPRGVPEPSAEVSVSGSIGWHTPSSATASFEQQDWTVAKAIDGKLEQGSGWAFAPRWDRAQEGVFAFDPPLRLADGERLRVELHQLYGSHHTFARLRLSAGPAPSVVAVPEEVSAALAIAEEARSPEQIQQIVTHFQRIDPRTAELRTALEAARAERAALRVVRTPVLQELPPEQHRASHVMARGSFLAPTEQVHAAVPAAFHPFPAGEPRNRLGLARWLVHRDNPLTARVQVNRLWAHLFGQGLVATEEDFGTQGARPTHPELLDWLAVEFMDSGWDLRHVLRLIVHSQTYRQAAFADDAVRSFDPGNELLTRGPRFRLEAEMVRDQALAFAGLLSPRRYGPSVFPPQPEGLWQAAFNGADRTWRTSEGGDRWRRALYTFFRRSSPYPSMTMFDVPSREICTARRVRTNTPLQAFVTLNDPVFVEAAQALARRIVTEGGVVAPERIRWAVRSLLLREPRPEELDALLALYRSERAHYAIHAQAARELVTVPFGPLPAGLDPAEAAAWTCVANALLNLDSVVTRP